MQLAMFLNFALQNWFLFALVIVIVTLLLLLPLIQSAQGVKQIAALHLPQLQRGQYAIVDVSEPTEFGRGHLPEATNIPLNTLLDDKNPLKKQRDHNIILTCASGNKSATAARHLKKQGFEKVYTLSGGILAWQRENLPLETGK